MIFIHFKGWFQAPLALSAPRNDLNFIHALSNYEDSELSSATVDKFKKHLWYLSELNVCLAFFDEDVDDQVKRKMVIGLKKQTSGRNSIRAKRFKSTLSDYVSQRSLQFFDILQLKTDFLFNTDPSEWATNEEYLQAKSCTENLSVINDCAERAVALCGEFNGIGPKDDNEKNDLLLSVAKNRKKQNNSSKASVQKYLANNQK